MKRVINIIYLLVISATVIFSQQNNFPKLTGPYLGQTPPGMTPQIFAPGIISTKDANEFSGTFSPDGKEYYFFRFADGAGLMESKLTNEGWTMPKPASFNSEFIDNEPHITYDGDHMFFCSSRPYPGSGEGRRMTQIWVMKRDGESWGDPIHLQMGMAPTTAESGNIYMGSNIYRLENDSLILMDEIKYSDSVTPEDRLPSDHTCISRDETFRVFDFKEILYANFKQNDDTWGKPIDLTGVLNLDGGKMLPTLSPDNKYLFFCCQGDIYWVSAKIIEELRPKE